MASVCESELPPWLLWRISPFAFFRYDLFGDKKCIQSRRKFMKRLFIAALHFRSELNRLRTADSGRNEVHHHFRSTCPSGSRSIHLIGSERTSEHPSYLGPEA